MDKKVIFTPLGKGKIIHTFPDGSYAIELEHGGGHIFRPDELFPNKDKKLTPRWPMVSQKEYDLCQKL